MLKRINDVSIVCVDEDIINYSKEGYNRPRFAQIDGKLRLEFERALKLNKKVNLVIRTNEKNPEMFDVVEKVEF